MESLGGQPKQSEIAAVGVCTAMDSRTRSEDELYCG